MFLPVNGDVFFSLLVDMNKADLLDRSVEFGPRNGPYTVKMFLVLHSFVYELLLPI